VVAILKERLVYFSEQEQYFLFSFSNKFDKKVAENKKNWDENLE
jgi:hypothetical protein